MLHLLYQDFRSITRNLRSRFPSTPLAPSRRMRHSSPSMAADYRVAISLGSQRFSLRSTRVLCPASVRTWTNQPPACSYRLSLILRRVRAIKPFTHSNYRGTSLRFIPWCVIRGLNPRPIAWKAIALPSELITRGFINCDVRPTNAS